MAMVHLSRTELSTHEAVEKILGKPQVQYTDYSGYIYFYGGTVIEEVFVGEASEAQLSPIPSGHLTACPLCRIGQKIVWQFRDKVIYLLSIYSQIRIFIEYGNNDDECFFHRASLLFVKNER